SGVCAMGKLMPFWVIVAVTLTVGPPPDHARADRKDSQPAEAPARLVEALKDKDASTRLKAAPALKRLRPGQLRPLVPALVALLKDADADIRLQAFQILGGAQPAARAAAPALVALLKEDPRQEIRREAVRALVQLGPVATDTALPGLVAALNDQDADVRL